MLQKLFRKIDIYRYLENEVCHRKYSNKQHTVFQMWSIAVDEEIVSL